MAQHTEARNSSRQGGAGSQWCPHAAEGQGSAVLALLPCASPPRTDPLSPICPPLSLHSLLTLATHLPPVWGPQACAWAVCMLDAFLRPFPDSRCRGWGGEWQQLQWGAAHPGRGEGVWLTPLLPAVLLLIFSGQWLQEGAWSIWAKSPPWQEGAGARAGPFPGSPRPLSSQGTAVGGGGAWPT